MVVFGTLFLLKLRAQGPEIPGRTVETAADESTASDPTEETETVPAQEIIVYLSGAVNKPGVYHLPSEARVIDALNLAGGFSEEADESAVNLAEPLTDGEMIRFPARYEPMDQGVIVSDGRINVNTADKEELMLLPGIGEAKAEAIIRCREENGAFQDSEDLLLVPGIGERLLEQMMDKIKF